MSNYKKKYVEWHRNGIRDVIRHKTLDLLYQIYKSSSNFNNALTNVNRIQFLCMHHLFEDEIIPFIKLIEKLQENYRFVSYSEAIERLNSNSIDNKYIVFSFDDGIRNTLKAAEILKERNISACFFVPTIYLDNTKEYRDNFCINQLKIQPVELFQWNDLDYLRSLGHEVGAHTHSHANISLLSNDQLTTEIETNLKLLSRESGDIKHFAWPFGHFDEIREEQINIIKSFGFSSIASAERGCFTNQCSDTKILRDPLVALWPKNHLDYFMYKNILKAN